MFNDTSARGSKVRTRCCQVKSTLRLITVADSPVIDFPIAISVQLHNELVNLFIIEKNSSLLQSKPFKYVYKGTQYGTEF